MNVRTACDTFLSCTDGANAGQAAPTWEASMRYRVGCQDEQGARQILIEIYRGNTVSTCNSVTVSFTNY